MVAVNLGNNTDLDLKFYNTYGISKNYTVDFVDIVIRMQVRLNTSPTDSIKSRIRQAIRSFIEDSNSNVEKRASLSNLIRYLENNISEIAYIKFYSINQANIQNIEPIDGLLDKAEFGIDYVPEFLTVKKRSPSGAVTDLFDYGIDLDFI